MMVASLVLPAVLFAYASWLNYRHEYEIADDRIDRSLDILHEHTLKVFQTVERAIAEVDEIVRDTPDDAIRATRAACTIACGKLSTHCRRCAPFSSSIARVSRWCRASSLRFLPSSMQVTETISGCT